MSMHKHQTGINIINYYFEIKINEKFGFIIHEKTCQPEVSQEFKYNQKVNNTECKRPVYFLDFEVHVSHQN